MMVRGYVEIVEGWDAFHDFAVMDWSESGDSGCIVGSFGTRREAVTCAIRHARQFGRELPSAKIIPLTREVLQ